MNSSKKNALRNPPLLAVASGVLLGVCHGPNTIVSSLLCLSALIPLILALQNLTAKESLKGLFLGLLAGLTSYLISLHWMIEVSFAAWMAASAMLAIQPAFWAFLILRFQLQDAPAKMAALWTLIDIIKLAIPPSGLLPLAATPSFSPFDGIVWLLGEEGLTFFLLLINATLALWPKLSSRQKILLSLPILAFCLPNKTPNRQTHATTPPLTVAIIPSNLKTPRTVLEREEWMEKLLSKTSVALQENPDLILWSEGTPFAFPNHEKFGQLTLDLLNAHQSALLLTGDHHAPTGRYNSTFLILPKPQTEPPQIQEHQKTVLTALEGFPKWWPTTPNTTYIAGPPPKPLTLQAQSHQYKLGLLLCAEEVYPLHARQLRRQGTNLLLGINNHETVGRWGGTQADRCARLRAIETNTPMLRSTNKGTCSAISPSGEILWKSEDQNRKTLQVAPSKPPTFTSSPAIYTAPWAIISLCLLLIASPTHNLRNRSQIHVAAIVPFHGQLPSEMRPVIFEHSLKKRNP